MAAKSTKQTTVVAFRIAPDERQDFERLACAIRRATGLDVETMEREAAVRNAREAAAEEARRKQIYGNLRLMVSINRDGSLYEVLVLESSGQPLLDQAAQRIVRLAAPFAPFTGDLSDIDRLEIIRTWKFARGDRLSSN